MPELVLEVRADQILAGMNGKEWFHESPSVSSHGMLFMLWEGWPN
jgi:hypothetical protein